MKKDSFSQLLKSRIEKYPSPMDVDKEWQNFLLKKKRNTRNRSLVFLLIGATVLILGAILYLMVSFQDDMLKPSAISTISESEQHSRDINASVNDSFHLIAAQPNSEIGKVPSSILPSDQNIVVDHDGKHKDSDISDPLFSEVTEHSYYSQPSSEKPDVAEPGVLPEPVENRVSDFGILTALDILGTRVSITKNFQIPEKLSIINTHPAKHPGLKHHWTLKFHSGIGKTHQYLVADVDSIQEHIDVRNRKEKPLESISASMGIFYSLTPKWKIGLSADYWRWYDEYRYRYQEDIQVTHKNILLKRITYLPEGRVEEIYGDTTVTELRTTDATRYNTYRQINLGINFSYLVLNMNKFGVECTGGLLYNVSTLAQGYIHNYLNGRAELSLHDYPIYKKSQAIGMSLGADIDYKCNHRVFIGLSPGVSYFINSVSDKSYPVKSYIWRYGISAGLKYKF